MIEIKAKLRMAKRFRVNIAANFSPIYDDNDICLVFGIIDGPASMIDRKVTVHIGISEFIDRLPPEVAMRLRDGLNDAFPKQES